MNGRIYDSEIARFLSPDPIIQDPYNILNYNRYSYCSNNPLRHIDPTGRTVVPVYNTSDPIEISRLLNHLRRGGDLEGFGYNDGVWLGTTASNENEWGIIIEGGNKFTNLVLLSLHKIDNTHLGHLVLNSISFYSNINPLYIIASFFSSLVCC